MNLKTIEIDTKEGSRQKDIASACAAMLTLVRLRKCLHPSCDAHNHISPALAEKSGYVLDHAYTTYAVNLK